MPDRLEIIALSWPEIAPGDDLVGLLCSAGDLRDGDIVVVTSKVVSKAEGRLVRRERASAVAEETLRVVARRAETVIAETRHGLVMAAAGVDASNTVAGTVVLLPLDPDASARSLREGVYAVSGRNVGVVVSDTAGRAWRVGQTDMAVGCAGLQPLDDLHGTRDSHGNELLVTAPAVADELAAAADLVKGKTTECPVAVARGLSGRVLAPGEHGLGAGALVRPPAEDLFGLGTREAVVAAQGGDPGALGHFPRRVALDPDPFGGLLEGWARSVTVAAHDQVRVELTVPTNRPGPARPRPEWRLLVAVPERADAAALVASGRLLERADARAAANRLLPHDHPVAALDPGWLLVASRGWRAG